MRSPENLNLPAKGPQYNQQDENLFKKAIEDMHQQLRSDVIANRDHIYKQSSLALRRHQFLLMGSSNG